VSEERAQRKLAAILSADAVGYSRLMAADEVGTVRMLSKCRGVLSEVIGRFGGRIVDAPGDNVLAEFPSVVHAVEAALEIQRGLDRCSEPLPEDRRMPFRLGVHLGDVVVEGDTIYGDGVNVAARLEGLAEPGGVCISGSVYEQLQGKLSLGYEDLGEQPVKNLRPVRVYRVLSQAGEPLAKPRASPVQRRFPGGFHAGWAALVLFALLAVGWWLASRPHSTAAEIRALAVLPLEDLSGDPEQEFFVAGMTEALIADLAKIASLSVVSRTSVMRYAGARKALPEIAEELGVDAIVEGSVLRAGDDVRITAQLIDARTDRHLWSESYQRHLSDVLTLQSEVARAIAGEVRLTLAPGQAGRLEEPGRVEPAAYVAYLRGVHFLQKQGASNHRRAVGYFERAVEIDPAYALAWARLADAYT
jgi:TolB-like protein/class 3 adenylate cyclase